MIIDLRKKSQITIPREIVDALNLREGDHLEVSIKNGAIIIEPVAIYSKSYIKKLEDTVMRLNEEPIKYNIGPFSSVEDAISYLEEIDDNNDDIGREEKKWSMKYYFPVNLESHLQGYKTMKEEFSMKSYRYL